MEVSLNVTVPPVARLPVEAGFKMGGGGVITSRTIMLAELRALFSAVPASARFAEYRAAIVEDNALLKPSAATRRSTARHLAELYSLDRGVPVFRLLRTLWDQGDAGHPLLACLCASARDPLLRATAPAVLALPQGSAIAPADFARTVGEDLPGRYNPTTLGALSRNAASSWAQSGHLRGKLRKVRARAEATPASVAYALGLGYLTGVRGVLLFETFWIALLDAPPEAVDALAFEAGRRGWLQYRRIGQVVELGFAELLGEGRRG